MSKIWEWLKEWWTVIFFGFIVLLIAGTFVWYVFIHEPLTEGVVIGKDYTPAHKVYSPIHMNVNGKTQIIPHWNYVSEKWCITVQNGDDTDWWYVSESYYDSVKIGDWVSK